MHVQLGCIFLPHGSWLVECHLDSQLLAELCLQQLQHPASIPAVEPRILLLVVVVSLRPTVACVEEEEEEEGLSCVSDGNHRLHTGGSYARRQRDTHEVGLLSQICLFGGCLLIT